MEQSSRLFNCVGCHTQTIVCTDCDRGQIYCGKSCSQLARVQSHRIADKRYQQSFIGRSNHAARQKRYRLKINKVTDQGSAPVIENDVLLSVDYVCDEAEIQSIVGGDICHFCKKPVSSFFRFGFLQQTVTKLNCFRLKDTKFFQPVILGGP